MKRGLTISPKQVTQLRCHTAEAFHAAYRELEQQMCELASADGDLFLPNSEPEGRVQYVLVCMEPSIGRWARSPDAARAKVEAGFRNFLPSDEVAILHFCVHIKSSQWRPSIAESLSDSRIVTDQKHHKSK